MERERSRIVKGLLFLWSITTVSLSSSCTRFIFQYLIILFFFAFVSIFICLFAAVKGWSGSIARMASTERVVGEELLYLPDSLESSNALFMYISLFTTLLLRMEVERDC